MSVTVIIDAAEAHGCADKSIDIDFLNTTVNETQLQDVSLTFGHQLDYSCHGDSYYKDEHVIFPAMQYQSQVQQAFPNYETSKP